MLVTRGETRQIISPMATGNGAYLLHKMIESRLPHYQVVGYSPLVELFPFILLLYPQLPSARVIHATSDHGFFFAKRNTPLLLTLHHYSCDTHMRRYSSFFQKVHYATDLKLLTKYSIQAADELVAVSQFTASHFREELGISRTIRVIYNGVDEGFFRPQQGRVVSGTGPIRVLLSGNLSRRKGAHWVPHIARKMNTGITISYTTGLRNSDRHIPGVNLHALGWIPQEQMPHLYQEHDILLSPTMREGFGLAICEAMACGLPIVASNCSAIPELVDHGRGGFLCPVGDVDCFAEKINLLADSPGLRREMGQYNRAKVERMFTLNRMASEYRDLFDSILDMR